MWEEEYARAAEQHGWPALDLEDTVLARITRDATARFDALGPVVAEQQEAFGGRQSSEGKIETFVSDHGRVKARFSIPESDSGQTLAISPTPQRIGAVLSNSTSSSKTGLICMRTRARDYAPCVREPLQ